MGASHRKDQSCGRLRLALYASGSVLLLSLAAWASLDTRPLTSGKAGTIARHSVQTLAPFDSSAAPLSVEHSRSPYLLSTLIAWLSAALFLALVVYVLVHLLKWALPVIVPYRLGRQAAVDEAAYAVPASLFSTQQMNHHRQVLAVGAPADAIVATWLQLERDAEALGSQRQDSETSTELALRLLSAYEVPRDALDELAGLFREARFSSHELGEAERRRAAEDLRRIHEALGFRADASPLSAWSPAAAQGTDMNEGRQELVR